MRHEFCLECGSQAMFYRWGIYRIDDYDEATKSSHSLYGSAGIYQLGIAGESKCCRFNKDEA